MGIKKTKFIIILFTIIILGCKKGDFKWDLPRSNPFDGQISDTSGYLVPNRDSPKVLTGLATNISESTSTVSGDIKSIGSASISNYGHCWSMNPMPTILDATTSLGSNVSTGIFSSSLTRLVPNKTYYVRAYAINTFGTSYGNQVSFKTKAALCGYNNCETLANFSTFVYKISPSSNAAWYVGSGYSGNGLALTQNC